MRQACRQVWVVIMVLTSAVLLAHPARGGEKERWYVVEMFGGKAGWMQAVEKEEGERITTSSRMKFSLSRGEAGVSIAIETEFVETLDGKPVSMKSVQKTGAMGITQEYTFQADGIELVSGQAGTTTKKRLPLPEGAWLPPAAAERYVQQRFKSGAKEIVVRTMDPSNGPTVVTATRTGFEPARVEVGGRSVEAIRTQVEVSIMPGVKSTEYVDAEGDLIRSETVMGGLNVVMVSATKEEALSEGKGPSPEVMLKTFIRPDKEIKDPRRVARASYVLSVEEGALPAVPETGSQRVEALGESSARVRVDAREFGAAPEGDAANAAYLRATTMCNSDDEEVRRLTARATQAAGEDKADRAENIRKFVHRYISKKTLGVGFASASEVARNREGDCSEHGVLLAAMLRADGIPARVASGLVYAEGFAGERAIFGYHMWAQALLTVDGKARWVDLDATLPAGTPYDATHLTLGVSALEEGDLTSGMTSVATAMGRLRIAVEVVE
jgi:transglutaminase-like putative cysteine protease